MGFVSRVRKGLQKSAGFGYLFPEGSYGGLVCASGIVTHGKVAKLVADSALGSFSFLYFFFIVTHILFLLCVHFLESNNTSSIRGVMDVL